MFVNDGKHDSQEKGDCKVLKIASKVVFSWFATHQPFLGITALTVLSCSDTR